VRVLLGYVATNESHAFWRADIDKERKGECLELVTENVSHFILHKSLSWNQKRHIIIFRRKWIWKLQKAAIFFFLLGCTTLVESWPSQQFLSIWGDLGLVLSILWVLSSSCRSWHRLPIGTWVFLWMVSICVFSLQYWFQAFYLCVQTNSIFGL